jgi:DNA-binding XRE family transcriptional regulator
MRHGALRTALRSDPVAQPVYGSGGEPIEVMPVVVLFQVFPARPSSIPDIRDFVRRCLAESPLTEDGNRQVGETVFRALLDAAGPSGSIQVAFRIFPEHVEVDVPAAGGQGGQISAPGASFVRLGEDGQPANFADWMSVALRREGLTQEAAARLLGVSVKTVSRWVGGATEPRLRDLRRIQEVFGEIPLQ